MIFHTINSITIGDFVDISTHEEYNKVMRLKIPFMPKKRLKKKYSQIVNEWNKINNAEKVNKEISRNFNKLKQLSHIKILYPMMFEMLDMVVKYDIEEAKETLIHLYAIIYKRKPKTSADLKKIYKDVDLRIRRYKQMYDNDQKQSDGLDFEQLIMKIEMILAPLEIRSKKLISLPKLMEFANEKMKTNA